METTSNKKSPCPFYYSSAGCVLGVGCKFEHNRRSTQEICMYDGCTGKALYFCTECGSHEAYQCVDHVVHHGHGFEAYNIDSVTWVREQRYPAENKKDLSYKYGAILTHEKVNALITELLSPECKYRHLNLQYVYTVGNCGPGSTDYSISHPHLKEYDRDLMGRLFIAIALCPHIASVELGFLQRDDDESSYRPVPIHLLNLLKHNKNICNLRDMCNEMNLPDGYERHGDLQDHFAQNTYVRNMWYTLVPVIMFYRSCNRSASFAFRTSIFAKKQETKENKEFDCLSTEINDVDVERPMLDTILRFCGIKHEHASIFLPPGYEQESKIDIAVNALLTRQTESPDTRRELNEFNQELRSFIETPPTKPRFTDIDEEVEVPHGACSAYIHELTDFASEFVDSIFFQSVIDQTEAEMSLLRRYYAQRKRKHVDLT